MEHTLHLEKALAMISSYGYCFGSLVTRLICLKPTDHVRESLQYELKYSLDHVHEHCYKNIISSKGSKLIKFCSLYSDTSSFNAVNSYILKNLSSVLYFSDGGKQIYV